MRRSKTGVRVKKSADKRLVDYRRTYRTDSILVGAVERFVVTNALTDAERESHAIHPSEICHSKQCHRQIYYRIVDTPFDTDDIDTDFWRERIFAEGHDIHEKWQSWLWAMGKLYGYFKCMVCDYKWFACSPKECMKCGAGREKLKYKEVPIVDEEHMIVGHADGEVDEGLIEVKSIGKGTVRLEAPGFHDKFVSGEWTEQQLWNEIKHPFPSHVKQGMLYSYFKGRKPVIFIYECKWNQAIKEFVVRCTDEVIEPLLEACLDIKYAVKKHRPLDRPSWAATDAPACKACPYQKVCWNGEVQVGEPKRKRHYHLKEAS